MRDPRDDDELDPDGLRRGSEEDHEHESSAGSRNPSASKRLALSDEIARRWDPAMISKAVSKRGGAGQPLDALTRARYERQLGVDLGDVRIYTGEFAEDVTRQHTAEAVTVGGTGMILMGGTPDRSPATAAGQALLAHELTHVAQAARGIYRSAPGEAAPLATAEHEAEAEAVEAGVLGATAGGAARRGPPPMSEEEMLAHVLSRVVELLYEEERVFEARNGEVRMRGPSVIVQRAMSDDDGDLAAVESRHDLLSEVRRGRAGRPHGARGQRRLAGDGGRRPRRHPVRAGRPQRVERSAARGSRTPR